MFGKLSGNKASVSRCLLATERKLGRDAPSFPLETSWDPQIALIGTVPPAFPVGCAVPCKCWRGLHSDSCSLFPSEKIGFGDLQVGGGPTLV